VEASVAPRIAVVVVVVVVVVVAVVDVAWSRLLCLDWYRRC